MWGEEFDLYSGYPSNLYACACSFLVIKVWDKDVRGRDDFIGKVEIPLSKCFEGAVVNHDFRGWVGLCDHKYRPCPEKLGEILVRIKLYFGDSGGHVPTHLVGTRSRMQTWWYGSDGVDKYYKLGAKLGKGSFAVVHKCTKIADGTEYAVKFVDKMALSDGDEEMLASECEVLKAIEHPNCIQLFEIFNEPKHLVLVRIRP
eukprot:SAG31_NODE_3468_length_4238_cov_112.307321_2_plen_201_part_00